MLSEAIANAGGQACTIGCVLLIVAVVCPALFVIVACLTMKHRLGV